MEVCDVFAVVVSISVIAIAILWAMKEMAWVKSQQAKIDRDHEHFESMLKLHEDEYGPIGPEGRYLSRRN